MIVSPSPPAHTWVFAGGGTGGHIFPGLAIAAALRALDPTARSHFLCGTGALESSLLRDAGEAFTPIPASPLGSSPQAIARLARNWIPSLHASGAALCKLRSHGRTTLVAMGGYVCVPAVQAARCDRVLVNLDAVPGRANRWAAKRCPLVYTTASGPAVPSRWQPTPPITRIAASSIPRASLCRTRLGLDPARRTLLVLGGSQGARSLDAAVPAILQSLSGLDDWQVLHQCRPDAQETVSSAHTAAGVRRVVAAPFFDAVGTAWHAADLAVSRAGAGAVADAWASATPTLFVPYPYHKDQHQRHNPARLVAAGAALVCTDPAVSKPSPCDPPLAEALPALLHNEVAQESMRRAFDGLGPADGAQTIAKSLLQTASRCPKG